ncbi:MAG: hypothetical protein FJ304_10430 [Planctomycetes bacterium]|nr:hypothetical protein [Planctomycetota bacterium]
MTRHAREAVSLAVVTAVAEAVLQALVITDWTSAGAHALLFAFLVGPPLFLAMLTWRRRDHAARTRVLFAVAALCAVVGLGVLGYNYYRFATDRAARLQSNMSGLIVPLAQWAAVMAVWLWLVVTEAREKRAAKPPSPPAQHPR